MPSLFDSRSAAFAAIAAILMLFSGFAAAKSPQALKTTPTLVIEEVTPDPINNGVSDLDLFFSAPVLNFDITDLLLTRDGAPLSTSPTLTAVSPTTYTLTNLAPLTNPVGDYQLTVLPSDILSTSGIMLVSPVTESWRRNSTPTLSLSPLVINADEDDLLTPIELETIASDAEDLPSSLTYTLISSPDPGLVSSFVISDDPGLGFIAEPVLTADANGSTSATIRVTDTSGLTTDLDVEFNIAPVNDAPTDIALTPAAVLEFSPYDSLVGTFTSLDIDSVNFSYTLVTGTDSFAIVGDELRVRGELDSVSDPTITIRVRTNDDGTPSLSYEEDLVVTITPGNRPPTDITVSNNNIGENVANGTFVADLFTSDPNVGDSHLYELIYDESGGGFEIVGDQLFVADADLLNNEADDEIDLFIKTTDDGTPFTLSYVEHFVITLNNANDPPFLNANRPLVVEQINFNLINSSLLQVLDEDDAADDRIITVVDIPENGFLQFNFSGARVTLRPGDTFTQEDVNLGLLGYLNTFDDFTQRDSFTFQIGDDQTGPLPTVYTFEFWTTLDNIAPTLETIAPLDADIFVTTPFTTDELLVTDPEQADYEIIFLLHELPQEGVIFKDGVPQERGSFFTMQDVRDGLVAYRSEDQTATSDFMRIIYTDNIQAGEFNILDFNFNLNLLADSPPELDPAATLTLSVIRGSSELITESVLGMIDTIQEADRLTYRITDAPDFGFVNLSEDNKVVLGNNDTFTLQDVQENRVLYVHNGTVAEADTLRFVLLDTVNAPVGPFTVDIFYTGPMGASLTLVALEGGSAPLSSSVLGNLGGKPNPDQLIYRLTAAPQYGSLLRTAKGKATALGVSDGFTLREVLNGQVSYENNLPGEFDEFSYGIEDPALGVGGPFTVRILLEDATSLTDWSLFENR